MNGKRWMTFALVVTMAAMVSPGTLYAKKAPRWRLLSVKILACAEARDADCIEAQQEQLAALGKNADAGVRHLLNEGNELAVAAGLKVLQQVGDQRTAEYAAGLLGQEDFDFKAQVAEVMGNFKGKVVVDALAGLATSRRPFEREKAVESLGRVGDAAGIPAMVLAAVDKFFSVRIKACEAMGRFDDKRVVEALGKALASDGNSGVRIAAARALGETGSEAAIPLLIVGLQDESFTVQSAAYEALKTITKIDLGASPDDWRSWLKRKNR